MVGAETNDNRGLRHYFGFDDAAYEQNFLKDVFYETAGLSDLKSGKSKTGACVVVGGKGSGKTAISRYIGQKSPKPCLEWRVDTHEPFLNVYADKLGKYPAEVEAVILNLVLTELTKRILVNRKNFPEAGIGQVQQMLPQIREHFLAFVKGTKIKVKGIEWDLEKILDQGKFKFSQFNADRYVAPLSECFEKAPGLVLFDDIDEVFLGADTERYPTFIEGLIRAAKTVNTKFEHHLHFLIFLKYGVFRAFYERPIDYEKVREFIIVLRWDQDELEKMLAKRIARRLGSENDEEPWKTWARVCAPANKDSVKRIQAFLFDRCSGGPRDLINFCNKAVLKATRPEITIQALENCEAEFSEEKLIQIQEEYAYTYPKLNKLIEMTFEGAKVSYTNKEFRELIIQNVLGSSKMSKVFEKEQYFETANVEKMIRILYTVGFLGYTSGQHGGTSFVLADPRGNDLIDAKSYVIHPAYRRALRIRSNSLP